MSSSSGRSRDVPSGGDENSLATSAPHLEAYSVDKGETSMASSMPSIRCDPAEKTCFVEDGDIRETAMVKSTMPSQLVYKNEGINAFMGRPRLYSSYGWTTSQTSNTDLVTLDLAPILLNAEYANKLIGYNLIRGTFVVRVELNATPFHQGALLIHHIPNFANMLLVDPNFNIGYNTTLTSKIQHPGAVLDASETSLIYKIPYVGPASFFDRIRANPVDWGRVIVTVLAPLRTGTLGTDNVEFDVWTYMEDVELGAPALAQSKRVNLTEVKEQKSGPLSSGLSIASRAVSVLSEIPMLKTFSEPTAWALNIASGIASIFGFSKQPIEDKQHIVATGNHRYDACGDGSSAAFPMGLVHNNRLSVDDRFSLSGQDEMSFAFLKTVPNLVAVAAWPASSVAGTNILSRAIGPDRFYEISTQTTGARVATLRHFGPLGYVSNAFRMWSGSMNITVKLRKTKFHSGRLQATFTPFYSATGASLNTPITPTNSLYSLREVIDVRTSDSFTMRLPYQMSQLYLNVGETMGQFDLVVLNPLRAPESCSQIVEFDVYITAGDDFELQVPGQGTITQVPFRGAVAQSKVITKTEIGNSGIKPPGHENSSLCVGEHFMSVKQILNRMTQVYVSNTSITGNTIQMVSHGIGCGGNSTGGFVSSNGYGDAFSYFAAMYLYVRGGMRVSIYQGITTQKSTAYLNLVTPYLTDLFQFGSSVTGGTGVGAIAAYNPSVAGYPCGLGVVVNDIANAETFVTVPYYAKTPVSFIPRFGGGIITLPNTAYVPQATLVHRTPIAPSQQPLITRGGADDLVLSGFIGCPPLLISST